MDRFYLCTTSDVRRRSYLHEKIRNLEKNNASVATFVEAVNEMVNEIFNGSKATPRGKVILVASLLSEVASVNKEVANHVINGYVFRQEMMAYGAQTHIPMNALQDLLKKATQKLNVEERLNYQEALMDFDELADEFGDKYSEDPATVKEEVEKANQPDPTDMKSNPIETTINQIERISTHRHRRWNYISK